MSDKDTLYAEGGSVGDFRFNDRVAAVFDDMIDRSVPFYSEVIEAMAGLLAGLLRPGDRIYDLGCSTGTTLLRLQARLGPGMRWIGVDNAPAMLARARAKAARLAAGAPVEFIEADVTALDFSGAGAVLCNYTLQFIRPPERPAFIRRLHAGLRPGGLLLVSEKILAADALLNHEFIRRHHDFKRDRGYSDLEIARKREALENVLVPFTLEENRLLLRDAGFASVDGFFQWFNFAALAAVKAG